MLPRSRIAAPGACFAQHTIRVPADYITIQAVILSASNGDTVLVSPGTYHERIDFSIDGGQAGAVVSFVQGEGLNSVWQGFTFLNGSALPSGTTEDWCFSGGGIGVGPGSSPLIQGNTISNNTNCRGLGGGGIGMRLANGAQVLNNIITGNNSTSDGGGVGLWSSGAVTLPDYVISGNAALGNGGGMADVNWRNRRCLVFRAAGPSDGDDRRRLGYRDVLRPRAGIGGGLSDAVRPHRLEHQRILVQHGHHRGAAIWRLSGLDCINRTERTSRMLPPACRDLCR